MSVCVMMYSVTSSEDYCMHVCAVFECQRERNRDKERERDRKIKTQKEAERERESTHLVSKELLRVLGACHVESVLSLHPSAQIRSPYSDKSQGAACGTKGEIKWTNKQGKKDLGHHLNCDSLDHESTFCMW